MLKGLSLTSRKQHSKCFKKFHIKKIIRKSFETFCFRTLKQKLQTSKYVVIMQVTSLQVYTLVSVAHTCHSQCPASTFEINGLGQCHLVYFDSTVGFSAIINTQINIYAVQSREGGMSLFRYLSVRTVSSLNCCFVLQVCVIFCV